MSVLKTILKDRRFHRLAGVMAILGLGAALLAWKMGVTLGDLKQIWEVVESYLKQHPAFLFCALVVLPGLPIPTSALLLTAGVVWREQPMMACLLSLVALALNLTWTYWLAAGLGRRLVEKLLAASAIRLPELPQGNQLKLILVLKLTPGIPLFFQNYLLGFLRAPFFLYLGISILSNGLIGIGVVLSGAGLSDGRLMPALSGISLIVVGVVVVKLVREAMGREEKKK